MATDEIPELANFALAAAAAASAGVTGLVEAAREHAGDVANHLRIQEVAENLADALQSTLSIEHAALPEDDDRRASVGQLLAACTAFVEGWA